MRRVAVGASFEFKAAERKHARACMPDGVGVQQRERLKAHERERVSGKELKRIKIILYRYKNTGTTRSPWTTRSPSIRLGTSPRWEGATTAVYTIVWQNSVP